MSIRHFHIYIVTYRELEKCGGGVRILTPLFPQSSFVMCLKKNYSFGSLKFLIIYAKFIGPNDKNLHFLK